MTGWERRDCHAGLLWLRSCAITRLSLPDETIQSFLAACIKLVMVDV